MAYIIVNNLFNPIYIVRDFGKYTRILSSATRFSTIRQNTNSIQLAQLLRHQRSSRVTRTSVMPNFTSTDLEDQAERVCANMAGNTTVFYQNCLCDVASANNISIVSATATAVVLDCSLKNSSATCKNNSILGCTDACNYNGKCSQGTCICNNGYKGSTCGSYDPFGSLTTAEKATVIGAGSVTGIILGATAFVALASYGAKKGYFILREKFQPVFSNTENPLYEASTNAANNALYEP